MASASTTTTVRPPPFRAHRTSPHSSSSSLPSEQPSDLFDSSMTSPSSSIPVEEYDDGESHPPMANSTSSLHARLGANGRSPVSPARLAKLANAFGVSTPLPPSSSPQFGFSSSSSSVAGTLTHTRTSATRFLLHVLPPPALAPDASSLTSLRRGTLIPLHSGLRSQLTAIAREYRLPSTAGMAVYLIREDDGGGGGGGEGSAGPRISEEAWRLLWQPLLQMEREEQLAAVLYSPSSVRGSQSPDTLGSPHVLNDSPPDDPDLAAADGQSNPRALRRLNTSPLSTPSPYKPLHMQPGGGSTALTHVTRKASITSLSSSTSFSLSHHHALPPPPIVGKIEFDIERHKAPWFEVWLERTRSTRQHAITAASTAPSSPRSAGPPRVLQLPSRSTSRAASRAGNRSPLLPSTGKSSPVPPSPMPSPLPSPGVLEGKHFESLQRRLRRDDHNDNGLLSPRRIMDEREPEAGLETPAIGALGVGVGLGRGGSEETLYVDARGGETDGGVTGEEGDREEDEDEEEREEDEEREEERYVPLEDEEVDVEERAAEVDGEVTLTPEQISDSMDRTPSDHDVEAEPPSSYESIDSSDEPEDEEEEDEDEERPFQEDDLPNPHQRHLVPRAPSISLNSDPLEDVFPPDAQTWSAIRYSQSHSHSHSRTASGSSVQGLGLRVNGRPYEPEMIVPAGKLEEELPEDEFPEEELAQEDDDLEDVIGMWNTRHTPDLKVTREALVGMGVGMGMGMGRRSVVHEEVSPPMAEMAEEDVEEGDEEDEEVEEELRNEDEEDEHEEVEVVPPPVPPKDEDEEGELEEEEDVSKTPSPYDFPPAHAPVLSPEPILSPPSTITPRPSPPLSPSHLRPPSLTVSSNSPTRTPSPTAPPQPTEVQITPSSPPLTNASFALRPPRRALPPAPLRLAPSPIITDRPAIDTPETAGSGSSKRSSALPYLHSSGSSAGEERSGDEEEGESPRASQMRMEKELDAIERAFAEVSPRQLDSSFLEMAPSPSAVLQSGRTPIPTSEPPSSLLVSQWPAVSVSSAVAEKGLAPLISSSPATPAFAPPTVSLETMKRAKAAEDGHTGTSPESDSPIMNRTPSTSTNGRKESIRSKESSRFSEESAGRIDGTQTLRKRTNSIITVRNIRKLWRKGSVSHEAAPPLPSLPPNVLSPQQQTLAGLVSPRVSTSSVDSDSRNSKRDSGGDHFRFDQDSRLTLRSPTPSASLPSPKFPSSANSPMMPSDRQPGRSQRTKSVLKPWTASPKQGKSPRLDVDPESEVKVNGRAISAPMYVVQGAEADVNGGRFAAFRAAPAPPQVPQRPQRSPPRGLPMTPSPPIPPAKSDDSPPRLVKQNSIRRKPVPGLTADDVTPSATASGTPTHSPTSSISQTPSQHRPQHRAGLSTSSSLMRLSQAVPEEEPHEPSPRPSMSSSRTEDGPTPSELRTFEIVSPPPQPLTPPIPVGFSHIRSSPAAF